MTQTGSLFGDPITTNEVVDVMFRNYDQSINFTARAKLPRNRPHPFVAGYVLAMLEDWPFHVINDITERTYYQMIQDCGHMFWICRDQLGELSFLHGVSMERMGAAFWHSRQGHFGGFDMQDWAYADILQAAVPKFSLQWVIEHEDGEYIGKLDFVWSDPNGFDFT